MLKNIPDLFQDFQVSVNPDISFLKINLKSMQQWASSQFGIRNFTALIRAHICKFVKKKGLFFNYEIAVLSQGWRHEPGPDGRFFTPSPLFKVLFINYLHNNLPSVLKMKTINKTFIYIKIVYLEYNIKIFNKNILIRTTAWYCIHLQPDFTIWCMLILLYKKKIYIWAVNII